MIVAKRWKKVLSYKAMYIMVLPGLLYYALFHYLPMSGLLIAFKDFNPLDGFAGIFTSPW
ncbi:MAG: protein lplB, partial [Paenibacillus sp.]|nr:protein lplB [Paenibacillus sp.]